MLLLLLLLHISLLLLLLHYAPSAIALPEQTLLHNCHPDVESISSLTEECTTGIIVNLNVYLQQKYQQQQK